MSLHGAWQGERFARIEKLKAFPHYAKALVKKDAPARAQTAAEALSTFHTLAGGGAPISITRIR